MCAWRLEVMMEGTVALVDGLDDGGPYHAPSMNHDEVCGDRQYLKCGSFVGRVVPCPLVDCAESVNSSWTRAPKVYSLFLEGPHNVDRENRPGSR